MTSSPPETVIDSDEIVLPAHEDALSSQETPLRQNVGSSEDLERTQTEQLAAKKIDWKILTPGFEVARTHGRFKTNIGDSKIDLVRIDPKLRTLHLISAKEKGIKPMTAFQHMRAEKCLAVFNAGMYQNDYLTNSAFMKNYDFINNPDTTKDNAFIAFNPKDSTDLPFKIIDRHCDDYRTEMDKFETVVQGIRIADCHGNIKWSQQKRYWSMVVCIEDNKGNILFAFTRSPFSVRDFMQMLLNMNLGIQNAIYLEGGPEASYCINVPGKERIEKLGSYETDFNLNDGNERFWQIPNVIGVR